MTCNRCWKQSDATVQERGNFRLVRDPGHWGAANPRTLVLGISKGNTQSQAYVQEPFEIVAFKGIRDRLLHVIQSVGLLPNETQDAFERRFTKSETDLAFASVIRCSLTGFDKARGTYSGDSPKVLPAFKDGSDGIGFVEACVDQHLARLPARTGTVLLLSNSDAYIAGMRKVLHRKRAAVSHINDVSYWSGDVKFVHVAHPSRLNGHFGAFLRGEGKPGAKRLLAHEALATAA